MVCLAQMLVCVTHPLVFSRHLLVCLKHLLVCLTHVVVCLTHMVMRAQDGQGRPDSLESEMGGEELAELINERAATAGVARP